jgi:hypothetical protein
VPVGIGIHCSPREEAARQGDDREARRSDSGARAGVEAASWEARAAAMCDGGGGGGEERREE